MITKSHTKELCSAVYSAMKTYGKRLLGRGHVLSYGQNGEDAIVQSLLRGKRHGIYIDIGAYHPCLYSNTYALYRKGWRGVAVDPNAAMCTLFRILRPRDVFVVAGVGIQRSMQKYFTYSDGAYNTFDESEAASRDQKRWLVPTGVHDVPIRPLADIVAEQGLTHIDYLDVDVEGMDLEVLRSHDWTIPPTIITVESEKFDPEHPHDTQVYVFLKEKGYRLVGFSRFTLVFGREKNEGPTTSA